MKSIYTFNLSVAFMSLVYSFSCPEGEKVKLKHDQIEGFYYTEECTGLNWIRPDNFTQKALLGSGMNFGCNQGRWPRFRISDLIYQQNVGAHEFVYYPYKICLSVYGADSVMFHLFSEQCGYRWVSVTIPTLGWYSLCYEPTGDTLNCGVYNWWVTNMPSERVDEARIKNAKLVACKKQVPFVCLEGEHVHMEHAHIEGFYYVELCSESNWTHGFTQMALFGSEMSLNCRPGVQLHFIINDIVFQQMDGAFEYTYFPYQLCMSVFGTNLVRINFHSVECGIVIDYVTIPTLDWYSFCYVPIYRPYEHCTVHRWTVSIYPSEYPIETSVKDMKLDACRLQVPYSCDVGEHVKLVYDDITGISYHETCFPSGSDNLTQDALLGSGNSFGCELGSNPTLEISDPFFHGTTSQYEFKYHPYKICMSVFGAKIVFFYIYSEECGYIFNTKEMPTFEWHYFCFVPTYNNEDCDFYRMIVSIKPSETQIETQVKDFKLDACGLPASPVPFSCGEGEHVKLNYDDITEISYRETCSPSGSDNSSQYALLGSGNSFGCELGINPELEISDPLCHANTSQHEFNYYSYKICMSVFGADRVLFTTYSEECGNGLKNKDMPTLEWHYFCFVPWGDIENCGFYRMMVSIFPSDEPIETHVKDFHLDACRLPAI